jgi:lysophospholipase L1-like esterase
MMTRLPAPTKSAILLGSALALCAGAAGFLTPRAADGAVAPALQLLSRASTQEDADNLIFGSAVLRASLRAEVENRLAAAEKRFVPVPGKQAAEWTNEAATVADAPEEASDFMQLGEDASGAFTVASNDVKGIAPPKKRGGLTILQIGDSHTAADYFTGEIRRLLQKRFGNGGPGYLEIGRPHPGVRSAIVNVAVSPGWSYSALQKSDDSARYHLSGFDAETKHAGETLKFATAEPVDYDSIEIQTLSGPEHGEIEVSVNDQPPTHYNLKSDDDGRQLFTIPAGKPGVKLQKLQIKTVSDRRVTISGVGIFNRRSGVSYSNVGFPGATIDIVNKYDGEMLEQELKSLAPQIVVLAFGTNEGFNDNLDLERYRAHYRAVIQKIRSASPGSRIVLVGPPQANRVPAGCLKPGACGEKTAEKPATTAPAPVDAQTLAAVADKPAAPKAEGATTDKPADKPQAAEAPAADKAKTAEAPAADKNKTAEAPAADKAKTADKKKLAKECPFPTPPRLDPVREAQKELAKQEQVSFWDWASIMPQGCGPQKWVSANPRLMAADHVHFTPEGYRIGARAFTTFLMPVINQLRYRKYALSNN